MISIGVDPGTSGGVVMLESSLVKGVQASVVRAWKMPETDSEIVSLIGDLCGSARIVTIEKIPKFIPGKNIMGSQMAALYGNYKFISGFIQGRNLCAKRKIIFDDVVPQAWQKPYRDRLPQRSAVKTSVWKKALQKISHEDIWCPHPTKPLENRELPLWASDAALIALHGLRKIEIK